MSEAELLTLSQSTLSNAIALYAVIVTIVSGYLVVAYLVGSKLTASQVIIVNSIFVVTMVFSILAYFNFLYVGATYALEAKLINPDRTGFDSTSIAVFAGITNFLFVLFALKFMHDVRVKGRVINGSELGKDT